MRLCRRTLKGAVARAGEGEILKVGDKVAQLDGAQVTIREIHPDENAVVVYDARRGYERWIGPHFIDARWEDRK
jgi:hypothetical protein